MRLQFSTPECGKITAFSPKASRHSPGSEFLSDAPFFGLSLWTEFKLANCACASGWSCLMNLDLRSKFWLFLSYLGSFVGVSSCWPCSGKKELCTL